MLDDLATTETAESTEATPEAPAAQEPATSGNPAWEGIRSQLDPISFSKIEAELTKMDQAAQSRVQSSNEALKPWKSFADQGVTPDLVQTALSLQQRIDANPVEIYQYLGKFLADTGRMPTNAEVAQAEKTGEITGDDEPQLKDPRFDELAQQQQQIAEFLQNQAIQQQNAQLEQAAEAELDAEVNSLKTTHPELSDADVQEIMARAAFVAQQNLAQGKEIIPSLEEIHTGWFSELRNRFLSTPRAGDSAPRLVPTSGGMPSNAPSPVGQWSNQQVQEFIAAQIAGQQGR